MRDFRAFVRTRLQLPALEGRRDERIVEELAGQLDDLYRDSIARGVPANEAERQAIASVADWDALAGRIRDIERDHQEPASSRWVEDRAGRLERRGRAGGVVAEVLRSGRLSIRSARREPAFWAFAVAILALGIGATTAIFSVVDGVLLKPLPFPRSEQLVHLEGSGFSLRRIANLAENTASYSTLSGVWARPLDWTDGSHPVRLAGALALPGYLELFDARVALGRPLGGDDYLGAPHRAVLSWRAWREQFGGNPGVVGRTVTLAGGLFTVSVEIVGVLDEGFRSPSWARGRERDLYLATDPGWRQQILQNPNTFVWDVYGRLREGVTRAAAQAEMDAAIPRLAKVHPLLHRSGRSQDLLSVSVLPLHAALTGRERAALPLLLGAVSLLLLLACANVANLLLARGLEHRHEIAVRSAMGADRARILVQVLTESVLLAMTGGALGLALASAGVHAFDLWHPGGMALVDRVGIDQRALLFALGVSMLTALAFSAAPAVQAMRLNVSDTLKQGMRSGDRAGRARLRSALVAVEVAIAVMLLAGAGLLVNSLLRVVSMHPGFERAQLAGVELQLDGRRYSRAQRADFVGRLLPRVAGLPGVRAAAVSMSMPFQVMDRESGWWETGLVNDLDVELPDRVLMQPATTGFFAAIGAELRGSDFAAGAATEVPIPVVVSTSLARRLFGTREPVGRVCRAFGENVRVIGVVPDLHYFGPTMAAPMTLYLPWGLSGFPDNVLSVRTSGDPEAILPALRAAIWELDPGMPLPNAFTAPERLAVSVATPRFLSALLLAFATIALLLSAAGVHATMCYAVERRRRELGVRAALGADRGRLMRLVLWSGARTAAVGLALGVAGALTGGRALRSMLFGISPGDPLTLTAVAAVMAIVAMAATLVPAWRAARADPLEAMRGE